MKWIKRCAMLAAIAVCLLFADRANAVDCTTCDTFVKTGVDAPALTVRSDAATTHAALKVDNNATSNPSGTNYGILAASIYGVGGGFSGPTGLYATGTGGIGGQFWTGTIASSKSVYATTTSATGWAFYGTSPYIGGEFQSTAASGTAYGIRLIGSGSSTIAMYGSSPFMGGQFISTASSGTAYGIQATCASNNCTAVYASAAGGAQTALYGQGNATITGNFTVNGTGYFGGYVTKAGGGWRDDHPLKPATHMLNHGFVESDVMRNVYVGEVVLDTKGTGVIAMADWFSAVNGKPVVFTNADDGSPIKRVKVDVSHWRLFGKPGVTVSWQVTAPREDAWTRLHQPPTEIQKSANEIGFYMHPELHGSGPDKQLGR